LHTDFFIPHVALREFVSSILIIQSHADEKSSASACLYPPTPQHCLFLYIDDPVKSQKDGETDFSIQPSSIIVGPQITRVNLIIGRIFRSACIGFHPGGLHRLLGIPMPEIFDEGFDGADLLGSEVNELTNRLKEMVGASAIRNHVEEFLLLKLDKLKSSLPFDEAMKELMRSNGTCSIESIASLSCLSLRQFERKCHERIGLPPKVFARLIRFSKAYRLRERQPGISWTKIAHECSYFDQMHLIRDFKEFAGITPSAIEKELALAPFRLQTDMQF